MIVDTSLHVAQTPGEDSAESDSRMNRELWAMRTCCEFTGCSKCPSAGGADGGEAVAVCGRRVGCLYLLESKVSLSVKLL